MKLERFLAEREPTWVELESLARDAAGKPERMGARRVRRLGNLYRAAAADLAIARRVWPDDPVVTRLHDLVATTRHLVYDVAVRKRPVSAFFLRDYWTLVASRPVPLVVAAILLLGPALLAGWWAVVDPPAAEGLIPGQYRSITAPRESGEDLGLSVPEQAAFSSAIFTNNVRVTFVAFALGIAAGLGTAAVLISNGVLLGVVTGLAVGSGNGEPFVELVIAHGILELSCIAVAAAAGLRIGWALVAPGPRARTEALVSEAREAVLIVLGTAPWLVLAGLVEGFITPAGVGLPAATAVGCVLGLIFWTLVLTRGTQPSRS